MATMTIGEVAREAGIGVETVRFYERRGLIPEPPRRDSGYREYRPSAVRRLQFIRRAKELGFSLREISELLELRGGSETHCEDVRRRLETKIADIDRRVDDLRHMQRALRDLSATCGRVDPAGECPILDSLARTDSAGGAR